MQPNWQVFQARELTARAQPTLRYRGGAVVKAAETPGSHRIGALIVRHLAKLNPGLAEKMSAVPQGTQEEWVGSDLPPEYIRALGRMWGSVGVRAAGKSDPDRVAEALRTRARVAYLSLSPEDIAAAAEIAERSKALPWFGAQVVKAGKDKEEVIWGGGWNQGWEGSVEGVLAGVLEGEFGTLRTEVRDATPEAHRAEVMRVFDLLSRKPSERRPWVKRWQEWARDQGKYEGPIDGLWGPKSESAWVALLPRSYGRPTTIADLRALNYGGIGLFALLAAGIARDKWIAANPNRLPPRPAGAEEPAPEAAAPTTAAEPVPGAAAPTTVVTEETVVTRPEEAETGRQPPPPPRQVAIVPAEGGPAERIAVTPVEEPGTTGAQAEAAKKGPNWGVWIAGAGAAALAIYALWSAGERASGV